MGDAIRIRDAVLRAVDFWLDHDDFREDMGLDETQRNEAIKIVADAIRRATNVGRD